MKVCQATSGGRGEEKAREEEEKKSAIAELWQACCYNIVWNIPISWKPGGKDAIESW